VLDICDDNQLFILDEEIDASGDDEVDSVMLQNLTQVQNGHENGSHKNMGNDRSPAVKLPKVNIINPQGK